MPVNAQSVAALNRFLGVFDTGDQATRAREELARQRNCWPIRLIRRGCAAWRRDKRWQPGGHSGVAKGAGGSAPNDAEVLGALGQAYSRASINRPQSAEACLPGAGRRQNGYGSSKWQSLIKAPATGWRSTRAIKRSRQAISRWPGRNISRRASSTTTTAMRLSAWAMGWRARMTPRGRVYQQALRRDPGNGSALRGLVNIYQRQSPEKRVGLPQRPAAQPTGQSCAA